MSKNLQNLISQYIKINATIARINLHRDYYWDLFMKEGGYENHQEVQEAESVLSYFESLKLSLQTQYDVLKIKPLVIVITYIMRLPLAVLQKLTSKLAYLCGTVSRVLQTVKTLYHHMLISRRGITDTSTFTPSSKNNTASPCLPENSALDMENTKANNITLTLKD